MFSPASAVGVASPTPSGRAVKATEYCTELVSTNVQRVGRCALRLETRVYLSSTPYGSRTAPSRLGPPASGPVSLAWLGIGRRRFD